MSLVLPTASALFPTVSHVLVSVATTGLMRRDQAMVAQVGLFCKKHYTICLNKDGRRGENN